MLIFVAGCGIVLSTSESVASDATGVKQSKLRKRAGDGVESLALAGGTYGLRDGVGGRQLFARGAPLVIREVGEGEIGP